MSDAIDEQLREGLGPEKAQALSQWAQMERLRFRLDRWLVNGRSRALVALVTEDDEHNKRARKLLMKVSSVADQAFDQAEYTRHRDAVKDSPDFAAAHLAKLVHQPLRVGDGSWITFQTIAGKSFDDVQVLTVLLRRALDRTPAEVGVPRFSAQDIAAACVAVVQDVLHSWTQTPHFGKEPSLTVREFFGLHLPLSHLEPKGRLYDRAQLFQGDEVTLPGERDPLPNPYAAGQGGYFGNAAFIQPLRGMTHGDLHTDNALVRIRPELEPSDYYLIDNARYSAEGPLTRDPVHLVLYVVSRTSDTLSDPQKDALIELLLNPATGPADLVPGWLAGLVTGVHRESSGWIEPSGLATEWRDQTLLSLAACSLMFIGRDSVRDTDKPWYLRLGARALQAFAERHPTARLTRTSAVADSGGSGTWIAHLCREMPDITRAAEEEEQTADLVDLREAALSGLDRAERYREFVRKIGGPDPNTRYGTDGTEGRPEPGEIYFCPLELCDRQERREPGGPLPLCHLPREAAKPMRGATST
ncbi:hypothetical protein [Streptomyces sp. NBC_00343]|uniref:hypothetical protein n=1 Tax=Streptomyces sp. NBC_00343 TaxID=2975719 RepID=UPI002E29E29E|nr:hypothetical protein [Streptomyces sp. NBC_00343]